MFPFVLQSHEEAKRFRYKVIPNWDYIVDICAKDKAGGIGVEHPFKSYDVMSKEANEEERDCNVNIGLEVPSSTKRKKDTWLEQIRVETAMG